MDTKYCAKCGETKPYTQEYFFKMHKDKQTLHRTCKVCMSKASKKYKSKVKEVDPRRFTDRINDDRKTALGKARVLLFTYQKIDKDRGLECDLDTQWIFENITSQQCVYCGEKDFLKLGCDRLDNSKAHTKDNVVACCFDCNYLKWNFYTHQEMLEIGQVVKQIKETRNATM